MSTTLVLGADHVVEIVHRVGLETLLDELVDRLTVALGSHDDEAVETVDRAGFRYDKPDLGLLEWMPTHERGRAVAIKTVGYHPTNPVQRGLPSVLASTSLYDTSSGQLLALCDATLLTALRTGAASAVATDVLATPGRVTLGVIGSGAQAVTQIHAISKVRGIDRVLVFDTDPGVSATLAERVAMVDTSVQVVDEEDLPVLLDEVDVLCTCTSVDIGAGPVIADGSHRPHLHVNAVGADFPGKRELPDSLLTRALVCPDVPSQCLVEGESQALTAEQLGPDLAHLVAERDRWEVERERLTVFDSTGWALEDLVAAELVVGHARQLGLGVDLPLHTVAADPFDPYGLLRP